MSGSGSSVGFGSARKKSDNGGSWWSRTKNSAKNVIGTGYEELDGETRKGGTTNVGSGYQTGLSEDPYADRLNKAQRSSQSSNSYNGGGGYGSSHTPVGKFSSGNGGSSAALNPKEKTKKKKSKSRSTEKGHASSASTPFANTSSSTANGNGNGNGNGHVPVADLITL